MATPLNIFKTKTYSITTANTVVYTIPGSDAGSLLTGKLVLEAGDSIKTSASANTTLKLTLSVLESLNA